MQTAPGNKFCTRATQSQIAVAIDMQVLVVFIEPSQGALAAVLT